MQLTSANRLQAIEANSIRALKVSGELFGKSIQSHQIVPSVTKILQNL